MIFVAAQKNIYQDSYGGDIWSVKLSEGTFETYIMNGLKTYLGKLFSAAQMAGNEGYTLTDEETTKVNQAAAAYMAAMSEDEIAATHLNEEIVRDAYEQYVLARKLYDHVLADANVEISSDEARVIHLQKLLYVTQDLSEDVYKRQIRELAAKKLQITLAISLHAPNDELRRTMMPIAKSYSIHEIMDACDEYFAATGRRISFEYSLVRGVNDGEAEARQLIALLKGRNCHVNLIPVNPVSYTHLDVYKRQCMVR